MTPFATQLILAIIALLVVVLLVRMLLRWRRNRPTVRQAVRSARPTPPPVVPHVAPEVKSAMPYPAPASVPGLAALRKVEADEVPFADTSDYSYGPITPLLASLLPESAEKKAKVKRTLRNAGYYTPHAWHNLAATRYLGVILPIIAFGALLLLVPQHVEWIVLSAMVGLPIMGYAFPGLIVQSQASNRLKEIEQGMPDMLDMLNMCVSQGMTLPASLARVSRELTNVYPALAQELKIVSEQSKVGGLQQALSNFEERVDLPDVHSFTALLIQTERMGTSVSAALSDYSDNMRESLRQRADQKANGATFKLLFPTVLCLMPAVFLFLLGPAIIQLNEFYSSGGTDALNNGAQAVTSVTEQP
jgi:tight adherence protein C